MSIEISPESKDRSLKQIVSDLRTDGALLVRQEIALAKAELKEKAALFAGAGLLAYAGLLALFAALVLGLIAIGVVAWLAPLSVGGRGVVVRGPFRVARRGGGGRGPRP